ncbi:hypothetical protein WJX72_011721 [[Myrmecia] bisecta]|uniref:TLC domain-containing protein n=1 Tax=[Myrmecia] bisecta TaxID=41462 RepID=A0AAW1QSY3_9CHLO
MFVVMTARRVILYTMGVLHAWDHLWNVYTPRAIPVNHKMHQGALAVCCLGFALNLYWYVGVCNAMRRALGRMMSHNGVQPLTAPKAKRAVTTALSPLAANSKQWKVVSLTAVSRVVACYVVRTGKS